MKIRKTAEKLLLPVIVVLVLALTIGVFYIGLPQLPSGDRVAYKGPAAKLNGEVVSDKDFNMYLNQLAQQAASYGGDTTSAQLLDQALTYSIQNLARKQAIKEAKIKVTNADIDNFIKKRWPTEEEVQSIMQQYNFANKAEFRKAIVQSLEVQKFWAAKARELKMTVPKDEVLGMLEQIEISHILIGTKDQDGKDVMTDAEALKKANDIYKQATSGSDFAELARQNSTDPGSKDKGGSLGKMPLTQFKQSMVKEFVDASLPLKVGEISKPVKSTYGYHIIKLISRDMPKGKDYEIKYKETEDDLLAQKTQEVDSAYMKWENENNQKALEKMEILDPFLRGYRLAQQQKWAEAVLAYEKALKKPYYKNQIGTYLNASEAYLQLKKPEQAIAIMLKAPASLKNTVDYQIILATDYNENKQPKKAVQILSKVSKDHYSEISIHEKLKKAYTDMKMNAEADKEDQIIKELTKKQEEEQKRLEEEQQKRNAALASPTPVSPSPAK